MQINSEGSGGDHDDGKLETIDVLLLISSPIKRLYKLANSILLLILFSISSEPTNLLLGTSLDMFLSTLLIYLFVAVCLYELATPNAVSFLICNALIEFLPLKDGEFKPYFY